MRRLALTGCLVAVTAAAAVAPTLARVGVHVRPRLHARPVHVHRGTTLILRGAGFPRRADIVLRAGRPHAKAPRIGSARTGRLGSFRARIHIRWRTAPGVYVARACHDRCRVRATVRFRVLRH